MRKNNKSFLTAIVILVMVIVLAVSLSERCNICTESESGQPADFYGTSREVSLNEMLDVADQSNQVIYMPSELPNNLKLTTIYLKDSPFIAIAVYSAEGNKDYKTAELTIQITPSTSSPTYNEIVSQIENSEYEIALEINGWPVLVNEKAYVGSDKETREKYGDYFLLLTTWIDGMRYMLSCRTLITIEAVEMVGSMHLLQKTS